jgi:LPS export ABC transporter protein LptC
MGLEPQPLAQPKTLIHLLLAASLALALSGCEAPVPGAARRSADNAPSLVFEGFKARGSFKGVKQWEAQAVRARVYNATQSASAEQVEITYFQGGRAVSHARADHADIDLKGYDLVADGNVLVRAQNGVLLSTDKLSWDNSLQQVSTRSRVKVWRGNSVLTGRGLIADRRLENVQVQEDVKIEAANIQELRKMRLANPRPGH